MITHFFFDRTRSTMGLILVLTTVLLFHVSDIRGQQVTLNLETATIQEIQAAFQAGALTLGKTGEALSEANRDLRSEGAPPEYRHHPERPGPVPEPGHWTKSAGNRVQKSSARHPDSGQGSAGHSRHAHLGWILAHGPIAARETPSWWTGCARREPSFWPNSTRATGLQRLTLVPAAWPARCKILTNWATRREARAVAQGLPWRPTLLPPAWGPKPPLPFATPPRNTIYSAWLRLRGWSVEGVFCPIPSPWSEPDLWPALFTMWPPCSPSLPVSIRRTW